MPGGCLASRSSATLVLFIVISLSFKDIYSIIPLSILTGINNHDALKKKKKDLSFFSLATKQLGHHYYY